MPLISVVIPTHNRAGLLPLAISSVLNQSFREFEAIIVDDASEDNTPEVVSSFQDSRIRHFRHASSRGGAAARNTGILHSKSEIVAFLDDDDEWFPEKLGLQYHLLESSPDSVGVVYTGYLVVDRGTGRTLSQRVPRKRGDLSLDMKLGNCVGGTSVIMVRKGCLEKAGLFDERLPSFQDYDLWLRLSQQFQFDFIKEPMLKYYVHNHKIWTNFDALKRGMDIMLAKHGNSMALRRHLSRHCLSLGVSFCESDNTRTGREALLKGMRLYPFEARHYFNFCLSLLGSDYFRRVKKAKESVLGQAPGEIA